MCVSQVRGTALLPEVTQELRFISTMKPSVMKDITFPFVNPALKAAEAAALDRLDRKAKAQEVCACVCVLACALCVTSVVCVPCGVHPLVVWLWPIC